MKPLRLLVVAAAFAAVTHSSSASNLKFGPVNFKFSWVQQIPPGEPTYTTNKTSIATNITQSTPYTAAVTNLDNTELLAMLANSLTMTWPAGSSLKLDNFGDIDVVDANGIVEDVSSVFYFTQNDNGIYSGVDRFTETLGVPGEVESAKYTETVSGTLVYDDSWLPTVNGNATRITINGISTIKGVTANNGATFVYASSFIGTGSGSTSNSVTGAIPFIVGGTATGTRLSP